MKLTGEYLRQGLKLSKSAFPDYTGRKVNLSVKTEFRPQPTWWDGGTCHRYAAVCILTGKAIQGAAYAPPQFGGPSEVRPVQVPINVAILERTFFGTSQWITIFLNPENAKTLTA